MTETNKPTLFGEIDEAHDDRANQYSRVPDELKTLDQWVNWRLDDEGKKVPVNPRTLGNAGVTYENTWASFLSAVASGAWSKLGIGIVLTAGDPYTCIDLDKVISGRSLEPIARDVLDLMGGYVELSPSGTGLHIWVKSREVINRRTRGIEIYSSQRWMTVTGRANPDAPRIIPERTEQLTDLVHRFFPEAPRRLAQPQEAISDDTELWDRLFRSRNGSFVQALYRGDLSVVGDDHSRGVIMLANLLAIFTDGDEARMSRLLLQTGLVNDKWFERRGQMTWLEYQIKDAVGYARNRIRT